MTDDCVNCIVKDKQIKKLRSVVNESAALLEEAVRGARESERQQKIEVGRLKAELAEANEYFVQIHEAFREQGFSADLPDKPAPAVSDCIGHMFDELKRLATELGAECMLATTSGAAVAELEAELATERIHRITANEAVKNLSKELAATRSGAEPATGR